MHEIKPNVTRSDNNKLILIKPYKSISYECIKWIHADNGHRCLSLFEAVEEWLLSSCAKETWHKYLEAAASHATPTAGSALQGLRVWNKKKMLLRTKNKMLLTQLSHGSNGLQQIFQCPVKLRKWIFCLLPQARLIKLN